jgi:feruloyl esterase
MTTRLILRSGTTALIALTALAGCGGNDDDDTPSAGSGFATPVVVANAATACTALSGRTIAASAIGEPTTGAVVTSAAYRTALPDRPNAAGTGIDQATPDYCEVLVDIRPVDPTAPLIKSQVNLPTRWNGKKLQFGGGGYNGVLNTGVQQSRNAGPETPFPLTQGYMTAGTDSGHQNSATVHPAAFALNDEALANFAYASYKKTHDVAVQLGSAYYANRPLKSYYLGGSQGGREGLMMAQRYPADFDGIITIDPVINATALWTFQNSFGAVQSAPGSWLGNKNPLIHDTIAAACDAQDGIADNVVSNYLTCKPLADAAIAAKRCPSGADEGPACFSDGQLAAVKWAYTGYTFPFALANGITSYAGYVYGSELVPGNFSNWVTGTVPPTAGDPDALAGIGRSYLFGSYYVRYFIAQNPSFNALTYNPAAFQARVQAVSAMIDATNPDLTAFFNRGGKIILREDLGDKGQSPQTGLDYWNAVGAKMGKDRTEQFFAAYVATGLPHTSGGVPAGSAYAPTYGIPGRVDLLAPLEAWVERGVKPADSMTLTNRDALPPYAVTASKPMCRYPLFPRYVGTTPAGGNVAANYQCVAG